MTRLLVILLIALVFEAVGVALLSRGLKTLPPAEPQRPATLLRWARLAVSNPQCVLGVVCEAIFFGLLLLLLSRGDVSFVWPLTSLGLVLTTLAARWLLHEPVSGVRWAGVLLIVAGSALVTWSEHHSPRPAPHSAAPGAAPDSVSR